MALFDPESLHAGFFWGPRHETPAQCASRLSNLLKRLKELDSRFQKWEVVGRRKRRAAKEVGEDVAILEAVLEAGLLRTDIGNQVMEGGGSTLMLSHESEDGTLQTTLTLSCGSSSRWLLNHCCVDLPAPSKASERILSLQSLVELSKACVECWSPDHGVITSSLLSEAVDPNLKTYRIGWIMYRAASLLPSGLDVSPPSSVQELRGFGYLIIAMDEPPHRNNRRHVAILKSLNESLRKQGVGGS